ncbi:MAG: hypothetical protein EBX41_07930, partial [Chitinophagia bacterium]|nr:hypothetical protein [Chitinophagia bacterium]
RPDVWWNPIDGTKVGWHIEGDYLYSLNRLDATVWWNSHTGQGDEFLSPKSEKVYDRYAPVNYTFTYTSYISRRLPKLTATVHSRFLDGLWYHKAGLTHEVNDNNYLYINFTAMWRPNARSLDYLTEPGNWSSNSLQPNNSLNAQWQHTYNSFQGAGNIIFSLRTPALAGNNNPFNYSYLQMEAKHYWQISDIFLRSRVFGRWGMGNNIPAESALYLAGGSPEDQMENKYTRSKAFIPYQWQGTSLYDVNHYQATGGLGLRGYAGYYAPDSRNGEVLTGYKGRSGAAINIEADFDGLISLHPKLTRNWLHVDLYGFADAGIMELSRYTGSNIYALSPTAMMSDIRIDAGLGAAFNINKLPFYGPKMRPITLRIDFPLFINRTPYNHPSYTALRYVVGINRAF